MSDLLKRAQEAKSAVNDRLFPKWQRLSHGLPAFSGLELTGMPDEVREPFEADLAAVNRVLDDYPLERVEDYESISDIDLARMLGTVDTLTSWVIDAELDRIVADLDAGSRKLPVDAIRETREHRDLMIPRLIKVLRDATSAAREEEMPEGNAHFFAIFLLTEFQAEEAFPVIIEAFSLPGELPFDLFGDAVTSTLSRILAFFAGDRPALIDALIDDQGLNEYVRWEAAQTYVYLVRDGLLQRDEAVERLRQRLRKAIDRNDREGAGVLISELTSYAPEEVVEDIKEAYRRDLVDSFLVSLGDVEKSIAEGEDRLRKELDRCPATGIEDTIEELRHWAAFQEKPAERHTPPLPKPHFTTAPELPEPVLTPMLSSGPRIGRNDPCTCGSGKKYKRCCGARK